MIIHRNKNTKKKKKQNRQRASFFSILLRVFFWLVFLGFWGVAIWTLFFSEVMRVGQVVVNSNKADQEQVKRLVRTEMGKRYLSLVPKDNLLIIPKGKIRKALSDSFIFVKKVDIERSFPQTVVVKLTERESHIVWCSGGNCFLVDENAEAFYAVADTSQEQAKDLIVVSDASQKTVQLGERVVSADFVEFCESLSQTLAQKTDVQVEKKMSTPSPMSEEIRVQTTEGWQILFSTARKLEPQVEIIKKILTEKISPEQRKELEYLDLRIKGKATFKLKSHSEDKEGDGSMQEH